MSKPIQSFFDKKDPSFKLWTKPDGNIEINEHEIIFQAPLHRMGSGNLADARELYFVLTPNWLLMLKSETHPTILRVMSTKWVRCDYQTMEGKEGVNIYQIMFIRNMRYVKLFTIDREHFFRWKEHPCKVFLQCDFHAKFHTIKMIGKGSFARVYLVQNKENQKKFAVKAFSKEYLLSQGKGKESLINEVEVMQKLKHEFVMNLQEVHESKNSIYLVLELLEGGELLNYISHQKNLTIRDCHRIMFCILSALEYMNSKKIMHRDLKPDNMILKKKSSLHKCTLKLVDFGLATVHDIDEYLYKRCGTPGFVAPEVINAPNNQNIHYTPKCDVFSAGVIFYILLTERSPFDGKSFREILQKNKKCKINFDHKSLNSKSPAVDLLKMMLEKDPKKRISAADALKHPFMASIDTKQPMDEQNDVILHQNVEGFQQFVNKKNQMNMENAEGSSLIIRKQIINGNLDSVKDNSGFIHSLRSMSKPKEIGGKAKRESILKVVLLNNNTGQESDIYATGFIDEDNHKK